jgi:hypothetical protein
MRRIRSLIPSMLLWKSWPPERRLVEKRYRDISFPFETCFEQNFVMTRKWNLPQLCGYLTSWSALQDYRKKNGRDPLELIMEDPPMARGMGSEKTQVMTWPLTMKLARL